MLKLYCKQKEFDLMMKGFTSGKIRCIVKAV